MQLKTVCLGWLLAAAVPGAQAEPWKFEAPVTLSASRNEKTFHHLESAGRHNIAVSMDTVALAWEDDRDGTPRIYLARKGHSAKRFSADIKISGRGEAFEPSLVALDNRRFAVAWEEDARIHARIVGPDKLGPVITLGGGEARQPSLSRRDQHLLLVYSRRDGRHGRAWIQHFAMQGLTLLPRQDCVVDAAPAQDEQLYPSAVILADRTLVAWEDRRPGHTIIMAAQNDAPASCHFIPPQRISERMKERNALYGKGHGAARVALAGYATGQALAVWDDKRNFREGYDIYAAHYLPGNKPLFGPNQKVQDEFGGVAQQWHATVAGDGSGRLVVGWDDRRGGDADILLSWWEGDGWSDDLAVPGASGKGEQNHPTLALDGQGNLHLAWIQRATVDGPSQVRYLFARAIKK